MNPTLFSSFVVRDFRSLLADTVREAVKSEVAPIISRPRETQRLFLTRKEVVEMPGVFLVTPNDWRKLGIVPSYRPGTRIRYRYSNIQNAPEAGKGKGIV